MAPAPDRMDEWTPGALDRWAWVIANLRGKAKVLAALTWFAGPPKYIALPGNDRLLKIVGGHRRDLQRHLRQLEQDGLIERIAHATGGQGKATVYRVKYQRAGISPALWEWERAGDSPPKGGGFSTKGRVLPPPLPEEPEEPEYPPQPPESETPKAGPARATEGGEFRIIKFTYKTDEGDEHVITSIPPNCPEWLLDPKPPNDYQDDNSGSRARNLRKRLANAIGERAWRAVLSSVANYIKKNPSHDPWHSLAFSMYAKGHGDQWERVRGAAALAELSRNPTKHALQ